ncbi:MAG: phosphatase PAP2 family protein [Gammaproteobacteria bacterium]|nr:phosphatase PAP2 family protein [Gammaproteobacteria bacterium]MCH9763838.1 phosphatase PAP2 family protein [Gammaproteobacteria bacterium]
MLINASYLHYPGNSYLPNNTIQIILIVGFTYLGCRLQWHKQTALTERLRYTFYLLLTMLLIIIGCSAIQYTPFPPIDALVLSWDKSMHINLIKLLQWSGDHPLFHQIMATAYTCLSEEISYFPVILILFGYFKKIHELCFLVLTSAAIGYTLYFFFPTTAPASMILSPYFTSSHYATGLKFNEIHTYISPSTADGGLISFPSFHVIWAWFSAFIFLEWPIVFSLLLAGNILICISCVLLGWHYVSDIIGSCIIIAISHYAYAKCYPIQGKPYTSISFKTPANRQPAVANRL